MNPKTLFRVNVLLAQVALVAGLVLQMVLPSGSAAQSFTNFETGQVRPLALSPDGSRLFAVNTPDSRLEIFSVSGGTIVHQSSVEVGSEPSAVAARTNGEVWVVNHLSDSVSIVDVAASPPRVVRTLLTCDEPRDIVFAGTGGNRAFITAARRGQNCPVAANLTTAGTGRALVQVFDATALGAGLGGTPIANIALFGDTPRALTTNGSTVWAGVFHSGNQTTAINGETVCNGGAAAGACSVLGFSVPGGLPAPNVDDNGLPQPEVGLIVKFNPGSAQWRDELGRNWNSVVRFNLPDRDVFQINANATPPVANGTSHVSVGTVLFNMVVNPANGRVYVSNTDARNEVRFEGPGDNAPLPTVRGHLHEARVTVINGATVTPRHLNKHIDYSIVPSPAGTLENSLAIPVGMAVTSDGATLYVAAFGSNKVGIFSTSQLEANTFVPSSSSHIPVTGGGPTGLALDEANDRLYVLTRFDNSISVIDTNLNSQVDHVAIYNPEPPEVVDGRPFLYDATLTSSNGEASCAACHVFSDLDSLGWDLGDPDGTELNNPLPFRIGPLGIDEDFHPLKGPMTTQTLRGMETHGAMHWRGDRVGANVFDEDAAFKKFNPAFEGLIGRASQLTAAEMQAYTDFILTVALPPNPIRSLNNVLNATQQAGRNMFSGPITDTLFNCNGCHTLNPALGFFGTDGFGTFEAETQMFKVPHLRNVYQKIGMFGMSPVAAVGATAANFPFMGDQIRGYGVLHDGSVDTVFRFVSASVFDLDNTEQAQLEAFMLAFDTNLAPIVGQQITLGVGLPATVGPRIDLLIQRSDAGECDLIVKGVIAGEQRGGLYTSGGVGAGIFQMDRESETLTDAQLRTLAGTAGQQMTYTCVAPGSGTRAGIDRDEDGFSDRDEIDDGTDPADPNDPPDALSIRASTFRLRDDDSPPVELGKRRLNFKSKPVQGSPSGVVESPFGDDGDPTAAGATGGGAHLTLYKVGGTVDDVVELDLDAARWEQYGDVATPGYRYKDPQHADGPIDRIQVRRGTLTVRGRGLGLYLLAGAPQGTMALRLTLGGALPWCAAADAKDPAFKYDSTARFDGVKDTPAPTSCPDVPGSLPGSTSLAFLAPSAGLLD